MSIPDYVFLPWETLQQSITLSRQWGVNLTNLVRKLQSQEFTSSGATGARPTGTAAGYMYYDTTLTKPIWSTGAGWVDATGMGV